MTDVVAPLVPVTTPPGDVAALSLLLKDAAPGSIFPYTSLQAALAEDPQQVQRHRIYTAMAKLNQRLLDAEQRYWHVVRNVGYRLLKAEEHFPVAQQRRVRAERQIQLGLHLVQQVRQDELTPAQRASNAGMLMVMSGLYAAIRDTAARQQRQESVLDALRKRVDRLEEKQHGSASGRGEPRQG